MENIHSEKLPKTKSNTRICSNPNCAFAGVHQGFDKFSADKRTKNGVQAECRVCATQRKRNKYRSLNKTDRKNLALNKYGIDSSEYDRMFKEQKGLCKLCKTDRPGGQWKDSLYVDHNHKDGTVRGLLCCRCNSALGYFKDNVQLLEIAIEYIKSNGDLKNGVEVSET